jgi:hypothetical protein
MYLPPCSGPMLKAFFRWSVLPSGTTWSRSLSLKVTTASLTAEQEEEALVLARCVPEALTEAKVERALQLYTALLSGSASAPPMEYFPFYHILRTICKWPQWTVPYTYSGEMMTIRFSSGPVLPVYTSSSKLVAAELSNFNLAQHDIKHMSLLEMLHAYMEFAEATPKLQLSLNLNKVSQHAFGFNGAMLLTSLACSVHAEQALSSILRCVKFGLPLDKASADIVHDMHFRLNYQECGETKVDPRGESEPELVFDLDEAADGSLSLAVSTALDLSLKAGFMANEAAGVETQQDTPPQSLSLSMNEVLKIAHQVGASSVTIAKGWDRKQQLDTVKVTVSDLALVWCKVSQT